MFVRVFLGWGASDNAIFMRDASRNPIWRGVVQQAARFRLVWLLLALVLGIAGYLLVGTLLIFLVLPLVIFTLALALSLGPIIAEERSRLSWEPLLTVPYDMQAILLGKASGALWHIRLLTYAIGILLMCISAGVGTVGLTLIPDELTQANGWQGIGLYGVLLLAPIMSSLLFIWDRMQHYALLAVAALASGTAATSIRSALSTATSAVVLIWVVEIAATQIFLALEQGDGWRLDLTSVLSVATLGPVVSGISQMELRHAALFLGGILLLREVAIGSLWRWILQRARD
ncbi:MAG: hypothetical protein GX573_26645 [Chloroflexi bacterium]|nr:hypothetical protein [Chloroflexota bacterium]